MGVSNSKNTVLINDVTKIKLPRKTKLIKISSYNINVRNSITLGSKISEIIKYFSDNFKKKCIDILCIQGIRDYNSGFALFKAFTKYEKINKIKLYYTPEFDETSFGSYNSNQRNSSRKKSQSKKIVYQNMIISRYPIVSNMYKELDDTTEFDDIVGVKTVVGIVINFFGKKLAIYCTRLTKDIDNSNMLNDNVRLKELEELYASHISFTKINKIDTGIIVGSFNFNEKIKNENNEEYDQMVEKYNMIDIFRIVNGDSDPGYTNSIKDRHNYLMFFLTDDLYDESSPYSKLLKNVNTTFDMLQLIYKRYGIYFIDCCVRNDINQTQTYVNYPVECIAVIKIRY